jgi:hypothetical protein
VSGGLSVDFRFPESLRLVAARLPHPPAGRSGLCALSVHDLSAGEGPAPSADGLKKAPARATLPHKGEGARDISRVNHPLAPCLSRRGIVPVLAPDSWLLTPS